MVLILKISRLEKRKVKSNLKPTHPQLLKLSVFDNPPRSPTIPIPPTISL